MKEVTIKLYSFDELEPKAKERAREWYRSGQQDDSFWSECVLEDADRMAQILGIDLHTKTLKGAKPTIYWSGFSSQGDGACFVGRYRYAKGSAKKIRSEAPEDVELHRIADGLYALQKIGRFGLAVDVTHRGPYYHSRSVSFDDISSHELRVSHDTVMDEVCLLLRAFMDWIYKQLEKAYDWTNADQQVDENIMANDYEFNSDGTIA